MRRKKEIADTRTIEQQAGDWIIRKGTYLGHNVGRMDVDGIGTDIGLWFRQADGSEVFDCVFVGPDAPENIDRVLRWSLGKSLGFPNVERAYAHVTRVGL